MTRAADSAYDAGADTAAPRGRLLHKYAILLALVVATALTASAAVGVAFSFRQGKAMLARLQQDKAAAAAGAIAQFMSEIERQVGWATHAGVFVPGASTLEQRRVDFVRLLRQAPAVSELTWLDPEGRERLRVSRVGMDGVGNGPDRSGEPRFKEAIARSIYRGPVYFQKGSEPYMTLALAGTGRSAGVTVAEINLKFVWDAISAIRVGREGLAYVVDPAGRLVAHPDISLVLRKTDLAALAQVRAALDGARESGEVAARSLDGREVLSAHSPIAPLGWLVFVDLPLGEAFEPIYASLRWTAGLLLVGIGSAALVALLLARRMTVPIRALQQGAARIGGGDFAHRISVRTGDELEALAGDFNRMAERLQDSYATLERKVEDRTKELREALERLRALAAVGRAVNSSLDLETVLGTILAHACALADAGGGAVYVLDEASEAFALAATHGTAEELVRAIHAVRIRPGETIVGQCAVERDAVQVPDVEREPNLPLRAALLRAGVRALLAVPLLRDGDAAGALVVRRERPGAFDAGTVSLLTSFASQSALAIHNARLYRDIEEKGRQLEVTSRHKSQFLANMSHELRTPMNAILGFAELIQDGVYGDPPVRIRGVLERVQVNAKHLLGLINDILDLSKIEAGQLELGLEAYSLIDAVRDVAMSAEALAREKRLAFRLELPAVLPLARGDPRRVTQVLLNLVGNAVKFTDSGEVAIEVALVGETFQVTVADTGPGIPEAERERIFERFHQVDDSSTRSKGGTGLGLAISQRIVEMHGGRIWVEPARGGGSRFCFTLPVRAKEVPRAA